MGSTTIIEWSDSTLNFWRGCDKIDPTCANCYMFRDQRRYGNDPTVVTRCAPGTFYAPLKSRKWQEKRDRCIAERGRHLVFVCSWSDFFHEEADPWRADAWDVIRQTPESTYQILTSRPERILECLPPDWGPGWSNVWMGTTIGNRKFVHRADILRKVPAVVRFISAEPLLGPLVYDVSDAWGRIDVEDWGWPGEWADGYDGPPLDLTDIAWLICGGESGGRPGRRLVDEHNRPRKDRLQWVRDLRDACLATPCPRDTDGDGDCSRHCRAQGHHSTAYFFKQWGGPRATSGGRILDGREWSEMPQVGA
jgi:protein gp37